MEKYDIVIIGGGPAGLAAAVSAKKSGTDSILILERDKELGGILNQCIHNGFGLHTFKEELTGPEYAGRFIEQAEELQIEYRLNTMVMEISRDKVVTAMNRTDGLFEIQAKAVILAMGCRERSRGALNIPGYRPAGIFSAGTAQRLVNMEGYLPGRKVVILGSGDIGLIMARRMTLEGAQVQVVAELMPYSGGLKRNIVQCLDDYGIPLKLSHTVVEIRGKERVEGVTLARVDEKGKPIPGTEEAYECDTLLLSVGLIPENELSAGMGVELSRVTSGPVVNESLETNIEGVFACGNVLHVHDLVDFVSEEAAAAGKCAARYVQEADRRQKEQTDGAGAGQPGEREDAETGTRSSEKQDAEAGTRSDVKQGAEAGTRSDVKQSAEKETASRTVEIRAVDGVRYTVPSRISVVRMEEIQTVRFRVGGVYKNCFVSVYLDDQRILHRKRPVMAPGEMEDVKLRREELLQYPDLKTITVKLEEE